MINFVVTTRDGRQQQVAATPGLSIMEAIKDQGIDDILAICGGFCSCSTCHIYVDEAFLNRLPPMGDEEAELLADTPMQTDASRLACQLAVTPDLEGVRFTIPQAG